MLGEAAFRPCCEQAQSVYDCPRCLHREYQDTGVYAEFVTCENQPCGETFQVKRHPVLHPGETYLSFRPGFAHLIGFHCPEREWTMREEPQQALFPYF